MLLLGDGFVVFLCQVHIKTSNKCGSMASHSSSSHLLSPHSSQCSLKNLSLASGQEKRGAFPAPLWVSPAPLLFQRRGESCDDIQSAFLVGVRGSQSVDIQPMMPLWCISLEADNEQTHWHAFGKVKGQNGSIKWRRRQEHVAKFKTIDLLAWLFLFPVMHLHIKSLCLFGMNQASFFLFNLF